MKRPWLPVAILIAAAAAWLFLRDNRNRGSAERPPQPVENAGRNAAGGPAPAAPATAAKAAGDERERIDLADELNAPAGTIAKDLEILRAVFTAWLTNFPAEGNPVGENAEITAALTGRNRFQLALIPPDHRAINARGELVDRWGTPYRLHQLSGTKMEFRSAGPDRKFATADDAISTP